MIDSITSRLRRAFLFSAWVACLACPSAATADESAAGLGFETKDDRIVLTHSGGTIGEYVFRDPKILRPCFSNLRLPGQVQVTRRHPPVSGKDATDHADMHPGVWLAFGTINGEDFWRNKARIEHVRFLHAPTVAEGRLTFATEERLLRANGEPLARMENRITVTQRGRGWRLIWDARITADFVDLEFGDQEEMGFGARVAAEITEKNGGLIRNSEGLKTAKDTWGKPAAWCDSSGTIDGQPVGVTLMSHTTNPGTTRWHNRDYGLSVANAFGHSAFKLGNRQVMTTLKGGTLKLVYAAVFHEGDGYDPAEEYQMFVSAMDERTAR